MPVVPLVNMEFYYFFTWVFPILLFLLTSVVLFKNSKLVKAYFTLPGPFKFPLVGHIHLFIFHTHDILGRMVELTSRYKGQCAVWLGTTLQFMISDPEHLKTVFTSYHLLDHSEQYDFFKPAFGDGVFTVNGAKFREFNEREKCKNVNDHNFRAKMEEKFNKHTSILIEVLKKEAGKPEFPAFPYIRNCTADIIVDTQLEYDKFAFQLNARKEADDVDPLMDLLFRRIFKPWEYPEWLFNALPVGKYFHETFSGLLKLLDQILAEKKSYLKEENDNFKEKVFIKNLLSKANITKKEMQDQIATLIVTGYETSTGAIGFALLMLGLHQDIQEKVFQEDKRIREKIGDRELELDDLNDYVYLEQVINETLRLFPVGPILSRKVKKDIQIGDFFIPEGANVGLLIFLTHRRSDIYKDPLVFNPDNFSPENVAKRHPYAFVPFSAGPRSCIGTKYAWVVMKLLLSKLIRHYRVFANQKVEDIKLKVEVTMKNPDGYIIRIEERNK